MKKIRIDFVNHHTQNVSPSSLSTIEEQYATNIEILRRVAPRIATMVDQAWTQYVEDADGGAASALRREVFQPAMQQLDRQIRRAKFARKEPRRREDERSEERDAADQFERTMRRKAAGGYKRKTPRRRLPEDPSEVDLSRLLPDEAEFPDEDARFNEFKRRKAAAEAAVAMGGNVLVPGQRDRVQVRPDPNRGFAQLGRIGSGPSGHAAPRVPRPPRPAAPAFGPVRPRVRRVPPVHRHTQKVHLYTQPTMSMGRSTAYTVLSSGDTVAPPMGRVHLVGMGNYADPNLHFLSQMDADANMGAKKGLKKLGPFKGQRGASYVMDRSRHTSVRRRGNGIEITVHRGVSGTEIEKLIGRLAAHRLSVHTTYVYLVEGSKRRKLGKLSEIDLEKLKAKIYTLLTKRPNLGIHLIDEADTGAMHTPGLYKRKTDNFSKHL